MESTVFIVDHDHQVTPDLVQELLDAGWKHEVRDAFVTFKNEGQIEFELPGSNGTLTVRLGARAYYVNVDIEWRFLSGYPELITGLIDDIFRVMSILGFQEFVAVTGDNELGLVFEAVGEKYSLKDIMDLEEVRTEINWCSIWEMEPNKLNLIKTNEIAIE